MVNVVDLTVVQNDIRRVLREAGVRYARIELAPPVPNVRIEIEISVDVDPTEESNAVSWINN